MINAPGFWNLLMGGDVTLWLLLLCSLLSFGVMINRWLYYRSCRLNAPEFFQKFRRTHKKADDLGSLMVLCDESPGPLPALLKEGVRRVMEKSVRRDELEAALQRHARYLLVDMEKFLVVLATIGSVAPFIGLFGTVMGVMRSFRDLAQAGSGGATVVAAGIAQALIATAAGLLVAVPAVVAYNYFIRVIKRTGTELELAIGEALDVLAPSKER
jgi:biopolymer transport protein ExbB